MFTRKGVQKKIVRCKFPYSRQFTVQEFKFFDLLKHEPN